MSITGLSVSVRISLIVTVSSLTFASRTIDVLVPPTFTVVFVESSVVPPPPPLGAGPGVLIVIFAGLISEAASSASINLKSTVVKS